MFLYTFSNSRRQHLIHNFPYNFLQLLPLQICTSYCLSVPLFCWTSKPADIFKGTCFTGFRLSLTHKPTPTGHKTVQWTSRLQPTGILFLCCEILADVLLTATAADKTKPVKPPRCNQEEACQSVSSPGKQDYCQHMPTRDNQIPCVIAVL